MKVAPPGVVRAESDDTVSGLFCSAVAEYAGGAIRIELMSTSRARRRRSVRFMGKAHLKG